MIFRILAGGDGAILVDHSQGQHEPLKLTEPFLCSLIASHCSPQQHFPCRKRCVQLYTHQFTALQHFQSLASATVNQDFFLCKISHFIHNTAKEKTKE